MSKPQFETLEQAANWFALLASEEATADQRQQWQHWLNASPQHRLAWQYAEKVSQRFSGLQGETAAISADAHRIANRSRSQRRQLLGVFALAATGSLAWTSWRYTGLKNTVLAWRGDERSGLGEVRQLALADGSAVWLGSASAINLFFTPSERRLELLQGDVLVQTAKAPAGSAPFIVQTAHGQMQALGTRFSVRREEADSLLAVFAGAVEITTSGNAKRSVISAGEQSLFTATTIADSRAADPNLEAWSRGIYMADRTPLALLIAELRRHYSGHIGLAPELDGLLVSGNFPLNQPQQALDMLARVLPIRVANTLPWWIRIEAA